MGLSKNRTSQYQVRLASLSDAEYILAVSARVQSALTASGSLQELTPSTLETIQTSIRNEEILILASSTSSAFQSFTPIGSVTVSPFSPSSGHGSVAWKVDEVKGNTWYLHSLMIEPALQGHGLGKTFLKGALRNLGERHGEGTLTLDCWAGNAKLKEFYKGVGFGLVGVFPEKGYEIAVFKIHVGA